MRNLNSIAAAVLSAVMAAALVSGSAMATEVPDADGTYSEVTIDANDEMEQLKRLNPQLTDEQWETYEKLKDPEANGLILVSETERMEDGKLIVDSYYTDAIDPLVVGQKKYSAYSRIFSDGTRDGELLLITYMNATFDYSGLTRSVHVVPGSVTGFYVEEPICKEYFEILKDEASDEETLGIRDFKQTSEVKYVVHVWISFNNYKTYETRIKVNEDGEQLTDVFEIKGV